MRRALDDRAEAELAALSGNGGAPDHGGGTTSTPSGGGGGGAGNAGAGGGNGGQPPSDASLCLPPRELWHALLSAAALPSFMCFDLQRRASGVGLGALSIRHLSRGSKGLSRLDAMRAKVGARSRLGDMIEFWRIRIRLVLACCPAPSPAYPII